jgi:hypothetical protein
VTLHEKDFVSQFTPANNGILKRDDPVLYSTNTANDSKMKNDAGDSNLHRVAKVHDCLEMWQGRKNLYATQKESCTQNKQMTAKGLILDTEEIVKASWSHFQQYGAGAFKLSESSRLPPALSSLDLPGCQTE